MECWKEDMWRNVQLVGRDFSVSWESLIMYVWDRMEVFYKDLDV